MQWRELDRLADHAREASSGGQTAQSNCWVDQSRTPPLPDPPAAVHDLLAASRPCILSLLSSLCVGTVMQPVGRHGRALKPSLKIKFLGYPRPLAAKQVCRYQPRITAAC